VLGFALTQRYGSQAAFVAAGGYHHHIGLNTWESKGGRPPAPGTRGSIHSRSATRPRAALADALRPARGRGHRRSTARPTMA
jgi:catechol 2,3-dioxygenase